MILDLLMGMLSFRDFLCTASGLPICFIFEHLLDTCGCRPECAQMALGEMTFGERGDTPELENLRTWSLCHWAIGIQKLIG